MSAFLRRRCWLWSGDSHNLFSTHDPQVVIALLRCDSEPGALEDPLWMRICDWTLTVLFVLEMLLKIVDMGVVMSQRAYFRDYCEDGVVD